MHIFIQNIMAKLYWSESGAALHVSQGGQICQNIYIYIYTKLIYFDHLEMKTLWISINKNKNNATFTTLTSLFELFHNIIS